MKFKDLICLAEDTDEDILAGMDKYELENKPIYVMNVWKHVTFKEVVIDAWKDNRQSLISIYRIPVSVLETMDRRGWASLNGQENCRDISIPSFRNWWIMSPDVDKIRKSIEEVKKMGAANDMPVIENHDTDINLLGP